MTKTDRAVLNTPIQTQDIQERLKKMLTAWENKQRLTKDDVRFLVSATRSPAFLDRIMAILELGRAAEQGLYSKSDFLTLIEDISSRADYGVPSFVTTYARELHLSTSGGDPSLRDRSRKIGEKEEPRDMLDQEDRQFVSECFGKPALADRDFGIHLLAQKKGLDRASAQWGGEQIQKQIANTKGDEKSYWQFFGRVFAAQNPIASP